MACLPGQLDGRVFCNRILNAMPDSKILMIWEKPSRNLLGKSLLFIIGITNGHIQDGLLESLELCFGVSLNQESDPFLEADRCKSWYIWSLVVVLLDKMMLTLEISIHSGYGSMLVIKDELPRIQLMGQFHVFVVLGHLMRRDDDAVSWLVVFDL